MSLFSEALRRLLDETRLCNRKKWSNLLGIDPKHIESWLRDETLPRTDQLFTIWHALDQSDGIPKEPVDAFKVMCDLDARKVSPYGAQMLPTVGHYMKRPAFSNLSAALAKLSPEQQGRLLEELYPEQTGD